MSLISIIIPVYNVERFLCRCVDSVLAQTLGEFEVILVNDGSTDRSGGICDEYAEQDHRVRVIHKANGGVSSARNMGLEQSVGEYICFIDSDDWIDPTFLEDFKIAEYSADIYISGALYDIDDKVYSYKKYESCFVEDRRAIGEEFTRQNIWQNGYPWGKLYSTEIIRSHNLRFDESLSIHEDHLFLFEYYTHIDSIYVTDSAGYHYLVIDGTTRKLSSKVNSYEDLLSASKAFEVVLQDLSKHLLLDGSKLVGLLNSYVVSCHSRAFTSIFNYKGNGANRYSNYKSEIAYWREKQESDNPAQFNRFLAIAIAIMLGMKIKRVSYIILYGMFLLKRMMQRDIMKLIYADLDSRSTKI